MNRRRPVADRPRSVTLTIWGVLIFGIWNIARAAALLSQGDLQQSLNITPDPRLRLALALVWAGLFGWAAWALWRRRLLARLLVPALFILYGAYELGLLLLFGRPTLALERLWPGALISVLVAGGSLWAVNNAAARAYFGEDSS